MPPPPSLPPPLLLLLLLLLPTDAAVAATHHCHQVRRGRFASLAWDEGTVEWLSRTHPHGAGSYSLPEFGLSRVGQHVRTALDVAIDQELKAERKRR